MKAIWVVFICLFLVFTGCEFKEPAGPSWEMQFNVPLVNKPYPMSDLIDGENFDTENDTMFFYSDGLIEGANVEEGRLKISANNEGSGFFDILNVDFVDSLSIKNEEVTDDAEIVSATVREGFLKFEFRNIETDLENIVIEFLEIKTPEGENLIINIPRNGENYSHEVSLAEHRFIDTSEQDSTKILSDLHFNIAQNSNDSDLLSFGQMKVYFDDNMYFSRIRGLLHDFRVEADDFITDIEVDYPLNVENAIQIIDPKLTFMIYNHIGFDADFYCTVKSINTRTGENATVNLNRFISAIPVQGDSILTKIVFINSIETLMNIAPDKIEMSNAYFQVNNPDNKIGFALEGRAYGGTYRTIVPFNFKFIADKYVQPKELTEIEITEENREQIEKRAKEVSFNVGLKNYFDIGANVKLIFCNDSTKVYSNIDNIYNPDESGFGEVNTPELTRIMFDGYISEGSLTQPTLKDLEFILEKNDINIFHQYEKIYFGIVFDFDASDSVISPEERIEVITSLYAKLFIDLDDM
ncbi:MAG: hypothetical protein PHY08_05275 [Candidatus Cloacimonetes bacterium]|nr:hypothetical protein [Candidatus Cloacimonadota bacterium]MDD4155966.1 hypothetical protein [Candidatus Cloacimonadota bacterium]